MKIPSSKKCCFCLPLRKSLLCIGYFRLALCLFSIVQLTLTSMDSFKQIQESYEEALTFLKSMGSIVTHLLDLIFTSNFIFAAHKKSVKLFEVYYLYCITMLLVYSLAVVLVSCDVMRFNLLYCMMFHFARYIDGFIEYIAVGIGVIDPPVIIIMLLAYLLTIFQVSCYVVHFNLLYCMMFHFARYIGGFIEFIFVGIGVIVLQTYLTVLVRSETIHLKERYKAELARQRSFTSFRLPKLNRV